MLLPLTLELLSVLFSKTGSLKFPVLYPATIKRWTFGKHAVLKLGTCQPPVWLVALEPPQISSYGSG